MVEKVKNLIRSLAIVLLESGSEVFAVETDLENVLLNFGYINPNIFVMPTGVFYSFSDKSKNYSDVVRVKKRGINLERLDQVKKVLNDIDNKKISVDESLKLVKEISKSSYESKLIYAGLATAFFTLLYGGNVYDSLISLVCGTLIQYITCSFKRNDIFHFVNSFIGSFITAIIGILAVNISNVFNFDKIVIGSIMLLVPGLALTNSIKDTITGNLVSGMSRFGEVILIAVSISLGIWIVLSFYLHLGGTL